MEKCLGTLYRKKDEIKSDMESFLQKLNELQKRFDPKFKPLLDYLHLDLNNNNDIVKQLHPKYDQNKRPRTKLE